MLINKPTFERYLSLDYFTPECQQRLKEYLCSLCQGVYHNPIILSCGHVFCNKCVVEQLCYSNKCPQCEKIIDYKNINGIKFVVDIVNKQFIYCKNKHKGCDWIGKVDIFEEHFKNCKKDDFENCISKSLIIAASDTNEIHQKKTNYIYLEDEVDKNSENLMEKTSKNSCDLENKKGDIILEPDDEIIDCVFSKFGCNIKFNKSKSIEHSIEKIYEHNELLINWVLNFKNDIITRMDDLENKFNHLNKLEFSDEANHFESKEKTLHQKEFMLIGKKRIVEKFNEMKNGLFLSKETNDKKIVLEDNLDETKICDSLFDEINVSKGVVVTNNKVKFTSRLKNFHAFAFINLRLNEAKISWKVRILSLSIWIGIGVCDKYSVIRNGFIFKRPNEPNFNHSCFLLSSNSYIWNCKKPIEDNKIINCLPNLRINDEILLSYDFSKKELHYVFEKYSFKLNNVFSNEELVPCIIMLSQGDEVSVSIN